MNAIFLNKDNAYIEKVFPDDLRRHICQLTNGRYETVLVDELLNHPQQFADVKYLFSTWGMPELSEEQIRTCPFSQKPHPKGLKAEHKICRQLQGLKKQ